MHTATVTFWSVVKPGTSAALTLCQKYRFLIATVWLMSRNIAFDIRNLQIWTKNQYIGCQWCQYYNTKMDKYELSTKRIIPKNKVLTEIVGIEPMVSTKSISWHYLLAELPQRGSSSSWEICTMVVAATRLSCKYESPNLSARHQRLFHAMSATNPH
jgi:hypothetical protein